MKEESGRISDRIHTETYLETQARRRREDRNTVIITALVLLRWIEGMAFAAMQPQPQAVSGDIPKWVGGQSALPTHFLLRGGGQLFCSLCGEMLCADRRGMAGSTLLAITNNHAKECPGVCGVPI